MSVLGIRRYRRSAAHWAGLSLEDELAAAAALGPDHALSRALTRRRILARQLFVTLGALVSGLAAVGAGMGHGLLVVGSACLVAVAFVVAHAWARQSVRDHARGLVAVGSDATFLDVVASERRRLESRRERERLARTLEGFLRDAGRRTAAGFRPLPGIRNLAQVSDEVAAVARLLRSDASQVQGAALVYRFLTDGYASPLFAEDLELLRQELNRIKYLLESPSMSGVERHSSQTAV